MGLPVVIKYLREHAGMTIEEVFIEDRIIVGQRLGQAGETCGWDFLERCLVGFISARKG